MCLSLIATVGEPIEGRGRGQRFLLDLGRRGLDPENPNTLPDEADAVAGGTIAVERRAQAAAEVSTLDGRFFAVIYRLTCVIRGLPADPRGIEGRR